MRNFLIRDVLRDESVKYSMMRIYKSTSENPNKTINMSSFIKFADETNFDVTGYTMLLTIKLIYLALL